MGVLKFIVVLRESTIYRNKSVGFYPFVHLHPKAEYNGFYIDFTIETVDGKNIKPINI